MVLLAGEAGLRRGEVAQVHGDDLFEDLAGWSLIVHGKGGKQRVVPLTDRLANEFRRFCGHACHGYVFPGAVDGHLSAHYVGKLISRLMPPTWSMHRLRHRFAVRGYNGTHDLRALQEALGHSNLNTTQIYLAVSITDVRAVSEAAGNGDDVA